MSIESNLSSFRPRSSRVVGRVAVFAAAGLLTFAATGVAQQRGGAATFEIRLHRPATVGQRGRIEVRAEKHQRMQLTSGGRSMRDTREDVRTHFVAVERVLGIDARGKALHSEYTVEVLETDDAHGHHALLTNGQVLDVTRSDTSAHAQITVDTRAVTPEVRSALDDVISFTARGATDDDMFGTTQRQGVGARWAMNSQAAEHDLSSTTGIQATLNGQTRVVRRVSVHGADCLELGLEMTGNATVLPGMPAGSVVRTGRITARNASVLPIATTLPAVEERTQMTMEMLVDTPAQAGATAQVHMTMQQQRRQTYTAM